MLRPDQRDLGVVPRRGGRRPGGPQHRLVLRPNPQGRQGVDLIVTNMILGHRRRQSPVGMDHVKLPATCRRRAKGPRTSSARDRRLPPRWATASTVRSSPAAWGPPETGRGRPTGGRRAESSDGEHGRLLRHVGSKAGRGPWCGGSGGRTQRGTLLRFGTAGPGGASGSPSAVAFAGTRSRPAVESPRRPERAGVFVSDKGLLGQEGAEPGSRGPDT